MPSATELATFSRKDLAQLAKHNHVTGWHGMKKAELIEALKDRPLKKRKRTRPATEKVQALRGPADESRHVPLRKSQAPADTPPVDAAHQMIRLPANAESQEKDALSVVPLGSHWLDVSWRLTPRILERAESSLGRHWHQARPVLKLIDVSQSDESCPTTCCLNTLPIVAPVDFSFLPVADATKTYEVQLGYEAPGGHFFLLVRSHSVLVPKPGSPQDRKYCDQRAGQPSSSDSGSRFPIRGAASLRFSEDVSLELSADLVITGKAVPHGQLTCQEDVVPLQADGQFEIRMPLTDGRQVIPIEAVSADGCQSQTVILAIERNTKTLEPQDLNDWD